MCGIVGIVGRREAAALARLGLFALQHRGQESAGIAAAHEGRLRVRVGMGLVGEVFDEEALSGLPGRLAIGHVRYSTAGGSHIRNAQPLVFNNVHGPLAVAHNGNLTNAAVLRDKLEGRGAIFQSTTDSEVIVHLVARHRGPVEDAVIESLRQVEGAYSLLLLTPGALIAARDPLGFRPLVLGRLGRAAVFASETTALALLGARFEREVEPGEIVIADEERVRSLKPFAGRHSQPEARCVFEHVYFARPDSDVFSRSVQATRTALGAELAREMEGFLRGRGADAVVPVPDSGVPAALGFSRACGVPLEMGLVRSHYVGRTFIQPAQGQRDNSVALKLSPVREVLKGRRIVLVDDSIVRGTTSRKICRLLRRQGVREIHMAISSPPIISPCYYGIDTPDRDKLIAAKGPLDEVRRFLEVDSLHYLSVEGLLRAASGSRTSGGPGRRRAAAPGGGAPSPGANGSPPAAGYCTACFTGRYPTPLADIEARLSGEGCGSRPDPERSRWDPGPSRSGPGLPAHPVPLPRRAPA